MGTVTIRNLDDEVKRRLQLRAAKHGRSMEAEAREILQAAVNEPGQPTNLVDAILERFGSFGGVDLELPPRSTAPRAAEFDQS